MMAPWQPGYLSYAKCSGCKCWRLVPLTHPGAHGAAWLCHWCQADIQRWIEREMGWR